MNLTEQDLAAIKSLIDDSNKALEKALEARLIKRIDDLDLVLTTYIDNGLQKVRADIRNIKKTLRTV